MTFKNWTIWKYDSKNWTTFVYDTKNWTSSLWLKELNLFFWMWLQELHFECDSKNWTLSWMWLKESNLLFKNDSKFWTFFQKTCLKELNLFLKKKRWLEELNFDFFEYDSKKCFFVNEDHSNYTTFFYDSKNWLSPFKIWLNDLSLFWNMTQRIEFFQKKKKPDSQNWTLLFNMTHRNWTFLFNMTQRIEPLFSLTRRIELFFKSTTQRTEPFFNMSQRIEYDSKDWTFFCFNLTEKIVYIFLNIWLKELNSFFSVWLKELTFF